LEFGVDDSGVDSGERRSLEGYKMGWAWGEASLECVVAFVSKNK
jgi:hypothetical protein